MSDRLAIIGLIGILVTGYLKLINFSPTIPEFKSEQEVVTTVATDSLSTEMEMPQDTSSFSWVVRYWTLNQSPSLIPLELLSGSYTMYDPTVIEAEYKPIDKKKFILLTREEAEIALANGDSSVLHLPVSSKIKVFYEKSEDENPTWILVYNDKEEELGYFYFSDVKSHFKDKNLYTESE
jgi:hypothetical protein